MVDGSHDATAERGCADQAQINRVAQSGKQGLTLARHNRVDDARRRHVSTWLKARVSPALLQCNEPRTTKAS